MFVDASALVAILARESGFEAVADHLRRAKRPLTSGIAVYEAALAISRRTASFDEARAIVWDFVELVGVTVVPVSEAETRAALDAFERFGKGRGHPARLNMGDCFAYACARVHGVPLLFVGDDFARTDIPAATA